MIFVLSFSLLLLLLVRADVAASSQIPNAPLFYEHLQNRILTRFKSKKEADWNDPSTTFDIMLAKKMTYDQVRCDNHDRCMLPGPLLCKS